MRRILKATIKLVKTIIEELEVLERKTDMVTPLLNHISLNDDDYYEWDEEESPRMTFGVVSIVSSCIVLLMLWSGVSMIILFAK